MNVNDWFNVISLITLLCALSVNVNATVIINDATIKADPSGSSQLLTLTKSIPSGQGLFAIQISSVSSSEFYFHFWGIAEDYKLFVVDQGVLFDSNYVLSNTPIISNVGEPIDNLQDFSMNQVKYFGYWDDRQEFNHEPDSSDNYGWVSLIRSANGLEVQSGATSIGRGIFVGSLTQVPLPFPAGLFVSGLIFLSFNCRKFSISRA